MLTIQQVVVAAKIGDDSLSYGFTDIIKAKMREIEFCNIRCALTYFEKFGRMDYDLPIKDARVNWKRLTCSQRARYNRLFKLYNHCKGDVDKMSKSVDTLVN